ncbi:MAG: class I SAM-dependent methyltransferase, partial [Planctomycetota bacterium]
HPDGTFDFVYSIGCLHHTGDLGRAVSEVHRVLRPGGTAVVMLYNRHSFRQLGQVPLARARSLLRAPGRSFREHVRAWYDTNAQGQAAPHTDYVSRDQVRRLFREFAGVRIEPQNFDNLIFGGGRLVIPRERFLDNIARVLGLDLYITAKKAEAATR